MFSIVHLNMCKCPNRHDDGLHWKYILFDSWNGTPLKMLALKSKQFTKIASMCTCIWSNVERKHFSTKSTQSDYKWINQPSGGGGDEGVKLSFVLVLSLASFVTQQMRTLMALVAQKFGVCVFSQVIAFDYHLLSTKSNKLFAISQIYFKIYSLKHYTKHAQGAWMLTILVPKPHVRRIMWRAVVCVYVLFSLSRPMKMHLKCVMLSAQWTQLPIGTINHWTLQQFTLIAFY